MKYRFDVEIKPPSEVIEKIGLNEGGRAQSFFTNEVMRLSDDYVPLDSGMLKNNVSIFSDKTGFEYNSPYARYQWYGMLMVDEKTGKGAFFNPSYGFWSRPKTPKIIDPQGRKLNNVNGIRGPYWVERMWADRGNEICKALEEYIMRGK